MLRKPVEADIESMFVMLEKSLSLYLRVNKSSSKNSQLIIERGIVKDYLNEDIYLCLVAQINSEIAGWMAGSSKSEVLSEHGCSPGEFYIEELWKRYSGHKKRMIHDLIGLIVSQIKWQMDQWEVGKRVYERSYKALKMHTLPALSLQLPSEFRYPLKISLDVISSSLEN